MTTGLLDFVSVGFVSGGWLAVVVQGKDAPAAGFVQGSSDCGSVDSVVFLGFAAAPNPPTPASGGGALPLSIGQSLRVGETMHELAYIVPVWTCSWAVVPGRGGVDGL